MDRRIIGEDINLDDVVFARDFLSTSILVLENDDGNYGMEKLNWNIRQKRGHITRINIIVSSPTLVHVLRSTTRVEMKPVSGIDNILSMSLNARVCCNKMSYLNQHSTVNPYRSKLNIFRTYDGKTNDE